MVEKFVLLYPVLPDLSWQINMSRIVNLIAYVSIND